MQTILIIDDNSEFRETLCDILKREGYQTVEASEGDEGINIIKNNHIDLVITDMIMPGKEGIETIIELRETFPDVKIIAVSGGGRHLPETYLNIANKFGVDFAFTKPLKTKVFLNAVAQLIAS